MPVDVQAVLPEHQEIVICSFINTSMLTVNMSVNNQLFGDVNNKLSTWSGDAIVAPSTKKKN